MRAWGSYTLPLPKPSGTWVLGFMQRWDSGRNYDYNTLLDTRPYVTNPGYLTPPSTVTYYISGRGAFNYDNIWRTDLSLSGDRKFAARASVFFRAVVNNVFNSSRLQSFNTTILGPSNDPTLRTFNPFTTAPVEGVNWRKGPAFGQPSGPGSYQSPREANFSVGIRF